MKHFITTCLSLLRPAVTEYHGLGGLNSGNLAPTSLAAETSETRVPAWLVLVRKLFLFGRCPNRAQTENGEASSLRSPSTRALILPRSFHPRDLIFSQKPHLQISSL